MDSKERINEPGLNNGNEKIIIDLSVKTDRRTKANHEQIDISDTDLLMCSFVHL